MREQKTFSSIRFPCCHSQEPVGSSSQSATPAVGETGFAGHQSEAGAVPAACLGGAGSLCEYDPAIYPHAAVETVLAGTSPQLLALLGLNPHPAPRPANSSLGAGQGAGHFLCSAVSRAVRPGWAWDGTSWRLVVQVCPLFSAVLLHCSADPGNPADCGHGQMSLQRSPLRVRPALLPLPMQTELQVRNSFLSKY